VVVVWIFQVFQDLPTLGAQLHQNHTPANFKCSFSPASGWAHNELKRDLLDEKPVSANADRQKQVEEKITPALTALKDLETYADEFSLECKKGLDVTKTQEYIDGMDQRFTKTSNALSELGDVVEGFQDEIEAPVDTASTTPDDVTLSSRKAITDSIEKAYEEDFSTYADAISNGDNGDAAALTASCTAVADTITEQEKRIAAISLYDDTTFGTQMKGFVQDAKEFSIECDKTAKAATDGSFTADTIDTYARPMLSSYNTIISDYNGLNNALESYASSQQADQ
jgi:hypothetical protein